MITPGTHHVSGDLVVDLGRSAPAGADDASTTTAPTPQDPLPGMSDESTEVTAGLGGFMVVFALALAVWFLGRDLTRRLRRMDRAEEQRVAAARARAAEDATNAKGGAARQGRKGSRDGDPGRDG